MNSHQRVTADAPTESADAVINGAASRPLLAAHGALSATPRFGSQSVITTVVDHDCRVAVVEELLPMMVEKLRRQGRLTEPVTIDVLDVSTLVKGALTEVADLCQPAADIGESKAALDVVLAAKQGRGTDVVARIREAIAHVVEPAIETVHERIRALADSSPSQLRELGHDTFALLTRATPVPVDAAATIQHATSQLLRAQEVVDRAAEFAADDLQPIVGTLKERARDNVRMAFTALVRELVLKHLLSKWPTLTDAAEALLHLASELCGQMDAMNRACTTWAHEQREMIAEPPCNTTLRLTGTSAEEAIAGVLTRHRFAGRSDLVSYLLERGVSRLRAELTDRAQQDIAAQPAVQLLASVPAVEAFAAFRDVLCEELEPEVHTVYGRLQRHGVLNVLQTLIQRSRLTSDPGPRASARFTLNTYRIVIVSLPEVKRPDDRRVREVMTQALVAKSVVVTEHPGAFDEIVVHRVGGGWPWQVLPSNDHFRKQYRDSAAAGHRPHLVEVLPASPRGEIDPAYRTLPHERSSHGEV
jgi:hypothetical protein